MDPTGRVEDANLVDIAPVLLFQFSLQQLTRLNPRSPLHHLGHRQDTAFIAQAFDAVVIQVVTQNFGIEGQRTDEQETG